MRHDPSEGAALLAFHWQFDSAVLPTCIPPGAKRQRLRALHVPESQRSAKTWNNAGSKADVVHFERVHIDLPTGKWRAKVDETPTSSQESVNARKHARLKTFCTANPVHAMGLYDRVMYWENRAVLEEQDRKLEETRRPWEEIVEDPLFRFKLAIPRGANYPLVRCTQCKKFEAKPGGLVPGEPSGLCMCMDMSG